LRGRRERRIPQSALPFVSVVASMTLLFLLTHFVKLPHLEARVRSVENAVQGYVAKIGNEALRNSRLPEPTDGRSGSRSPNRSGGSEEYDEDDSRRTRR